jgi:hypothetical protein
MICRNRRLCVELLGQEGQPESMDSDSRSMGRQLSMVLHQLARTGWIIIRDNGGQSGGQSGGNPGGHWGTGLKAIDGNALPAHIGRFGIRAHSLLFSRPTHRRHLYDFLFLPITAPSFPSEQVTKCCCCVEVWSWSRVALRVESAIAALDARNDHENIQMPEGCKFQECEAGSRYIRGKCEVKTVQMCTTC